jgi:hypothetical protein
MVQDHDRSKYYIPNLEAIKEKVAAATYADTNTWTIEWRGSRPYIDVAATIEKLENDKAYDTAKPITYSIGDNPPTISIDEV